MLYFFNSLSILYDKNQHFLCPTLLPVELHFAPISFSYYIVVVHHLIYFKMFFVIFNNCVSLFFQWIYNVLDHKQEEDCIHFEDPDKTNGFVLIPCAKWDMERVEDLFMMAFVQRRDLECLRDLNADHLPLLKNILHKGMVRLSMKFPGKTDFTGFMKNNFFKKQDMILLNESEITIIKFLRKLIN